MIESRKLKMNSIGSNAITFAVEKSVSVEERANTFQSFKGVDGNDYIIKYDKRLNKVTNCYAFAMGWQVAAENKYDDYVPGFLSDNPYSAETSVNLVKADLEAVGRTVYEILYDIPEQLPDGDGYWVKFLHCPQKGDFVAHFMRKDKKSGRWIHKMGWKMPPKVCVRNLGVIKNELEMLDSADYVTFPEDGIQMTYKAMWVMRISEP